MKNSFVSFVSLHGHFPLFAGKSALQKQQEAERKKKADFRAKVRSHVCLKPNFRLNVYSKVKVKLSISRYRRFSIFLYILAYSFILWSPSVLVSMWVSCIHVCENTHTRTHTNTHTHTHTHTIFLITYLLHFFLSMFVDRR